MSQALTQILYLGTLCNNKFRKITQYRKTYPVNFSFSIKSVYDLGPAPPWSISLEPETKLVTTN